MSSNPDNVEFPEGLFVGGRLNTEIIRQLLNSAPIRKMLWDMHILQVSLPYAEERIDALEAILAKLCQPTIPTYEWHAHEYRPQTESNSVNAFEWKSSTKDVNGNA